MYRVTITEKPCLERVVLEFERGEDATSLIDSVFAGDMNNAYQCTIEIVDEENSHDVD